jgi:hypothetical protein
MLLIKLQKNTKYRKERETPNETNKKSFQTKQKNALVNKIVG